jgi:NAD(P)H-flavin reductase
MSSLALHEATLRGKEEAGGGLVRLTLEPGERVAASYVRPGQYIALRAAGKDAYFVLAGDVGEPSWELVLRPGGDAALAALGTSHGARVEVSEAQGAGFPMEEAKGRPLTVAVTGSGIAAGRPVVRARVRAGEASATELLVGVRTLAEVPLERELGEWSRAGVAVTVCLSREAVPEGRAGFASGYVQDVARARAGGFGGVPQRSRGISRARRMIFAAGVKDMLVAIRVLAADLGVAESDVRTNY